MKLITLRSLGLLLLLAATPALHAALRFEVLENLVWYAPRVETLDGEASPLAPPASPDEDAAFVSLDVRGVGDSGWNYPDKPAAGRKVPLAPGLGQALAAIDPEKAIFKGDLSFINFEGVVAERCEKIRGSVDYYFLIHPANVLEAFDHGFNLFGLANNHSQDCNEGRARADSAPVHGPLATAESMARAALQSPLLWHGVGEGDTALSVRTGTFDIRGRPVAVALGSISIIGWDIPHSASVNFGAKPAALKRARELLKSFQAVPADFRILAIHTQDASGNAKPEAQAFLLLKQIATEFITEYGGHVVYGHGPHTWGGVKVLDRAGGGRGVIFTSLGNFIHQGLGKNADNSMGRAIFDLDRYELREVQVVPFVNLRTTVRFYPAPAKSGGGLGRKAPAANFDWRTSGDDAGRTSPVGLYYAKFPPSTK